MNANKYCRLWLKVLQLTTPKNMNVWVRIVLCVTHVQMCCIFASCLVYFHHFIKVTDYLAVSMFKLAQIHWRNVTKTKPENLGFPIFKNPGFQVWKMAGNLGTLVCQPYLIWLDNSKPGRKYWHEKNFIWNKEKVTQINISR